MAVIGHFGRIVFSTSDEKILTFNNFTQKLAGNWSEHKVIGKKPQKEFNGPGLRQVTFQILLDANFGVKPRRLLETMANMIETGFVDYLVIGSKAIGMHRFAIINMSQTWDVVYGGGELAQATVNVTLEEYV